MLLIDPALPLDRQNEKLMQIAASLMRRVEQKTEHSGVAYAQFERAALLEEKVHERTVDLERTLDLLQESNAQLEAANDEAETARVNLSEAIESIQEGFALFDPNDRLVLYNSRFCRDLPDAEARLYQGLGFADYVKLISRSRYLELPENMSPEHWEARRTERHREDHVVFNVALANDRWLQISEHRTSRGGTVILQMDVTTIIRLERAERDRMRDHQSQILRATLDHLDQGVCIFDHDNKLVGWNKRMERLLDLPGEETALGRNFLILFEQIERQLTFTDTFGVDQLVTWANASGGRSPIAFEVTSGRDQILSVFGQEMPDKGFVISITDVSRERASALALAEANEMLEQRVAERTAELGVALSEAERANASKSRFVAAASHDLLQPLSAAKLFMSSLGDQLERPEFQGLLGKTQTALTSVETIIEALLDISKLDSASPVFDLQAVRLSAVLGPLRDELTPVAQAKGIELKIIGSALTVRSDPGYLRRIAQNLISNAIRYTDTGKVVVGARRRGAELSMEIWDTGRGIAEADQASVFEEFKRLDTRASDVGLGLGLAIVERACKGLGHPLDMCSIPGKGSRFSVRMPLLNAPAQLIAAARDDPGTANPLKDGMIVFLVENDPTLANAMTHMIEGWGAMVIHAANGEIALELLAELELRPDVLLLDYQLGPGISGTALYARIRALFGTIPARLITANRDADVQADCAALGIDYMAKPINHSKLLKFLGEVSRTS